MGEEPEIHAMTWPGLYYRMWELERTAVVVKLNLLISWVKKSRFWEAVLNLRSAGWRLGSQCTTTLTPNPGLASRAGAQTTSPPSSWTAHHSAPNSGWLTALGRLMPGAPVSSKEGMGVSDGELGSLSVRTPLLVLRHLSPKSRQMVAVP